MTGFVVTLMLLVGVPLLLGARSRIARLEHRLRLVEEELRRRIAAGREVLRDEPAADLEDTHFTAVEAPAAEATQGSAPDHEDAPKAPEELDERRTLPPAAAEIIPARRIRESMEPEPELVPVSEALGAEVAADAEAPEPDLGPRPKSEFSQADLAEEQRRRWSASINFEELFGRKLPIWAGGITLAIAGVLIVKYAIDIGFFASVFTPGVQAVCGLMFGLGLIGGAEWAWRAQVRVQDPRVSQAFSGAGISTLYAALLTAANVYHLISPLAAFAGLALVTAAALWLSLRHGMPSALLGLAGGLAAPAFTVGLDADVPMLATYLAFTIAGLVGVSRFQRWRWLAMLALAGGAGWSLWLVLVGQAMTVLGALSVGTFILLLAIALPLFAFRDAAVSLPRTLAALIGAVQLALLVAIGGYEPLHWGLFVLIAAAGQWLAWRNRDFAILPTLGAALSLLLLLLWIDPTAYWLAVIGISLAAIHALPLLRHLWREPERLQGAVELGAIGVAIPLVVLRHFHAPWGDLDFAGSIAAAAGALLALTGAVLGWKTVGREHDLRFALLLAVGGLLLSLSSWLGAPHWQAPLWIGLIAALLLLLAPASRDDRIEPLAAAFAVLTLPILFTTMLPGQPGEILGLIGSPSDTTGLPSLLRWAGLAAIIALFAWRAATPAIRMGAMTVAMALTYGALAQLMPAWALPVVMVALAGAMLLLLGKREAAKSDVLILPFAASALLLLTVTGVNPLDQWQRLWGAGPAGPDGLALARWTAMAGLFAFIAWRARPMPLRAAGQGVSALLAYGASAQFLPGPVLPLVPAVAVFGLAATREPLSRSTLRTAILTLLAISVAWAMAPLAHWLNEAMLSLGGLPMQLEAVDLSPSSALRRLLAPTLLLGGATWLLRQHLAQLSLIIASGALGLVATVGTHCLYRAGFASAFGANFEVFGLGQRLLWDGLLLGVAISLWKWAGGTIAARAAPALAGIGMLHFLWYSLMLHNPLWSAQHVGVVPLANLLLPLFSVLPLGLRLIDRMRPEWWASWSGRLQQPVLMILVAFFAWASLRQAFHGTLLIEPGVTQLEDILRSILGIALAIGYLMWGIRVQRRNWRLASLMLMLAAVAKVFLFDASGLEGLLRIASFVALGFSLIGIGWLYSRQLRREGH